MYVSSREINMNNNTHMVFCVHMHIPVADLEADVDGEAVPLPTDVATVRLRPPRTISLLIQIKI